ncbi:oligosaccharide flippase family protein [Lysinibacillus pakistanensis]|uniref:oligosaccharide flippase family protein n=1 Tax=Lysinibacillus pakistanensis TaxID=759811 RepID=UPI003D2980D7
MSQLKAGAILSYLSIFLTFAIGMLYTPLLIRMLGQTDYGVYSLILALSSYLSVLDMGLGNSIIRYIARNREVGDSKQEANLIGQFLKFFLVIGVLTIVIGGMIYLNAPKLFEKSLTQSSIDTAQTMMIILTLNYALSFPLNVYSAVAQAYERFVFLKVSNIIRITLTPIFSLIALYLGQGLIAITLITTIVNVGILLITALYCKITLKIKTTFSPIPKNLKKEIYIYSFFIFISAIADKLYWQTDQVLLGIITNPDIVAVYAVAIQLILIFSSLSNAISSLFLPRLSKIASSGENVALINQIFLNVSKYQFIIITLVFSGFIIFGQEFIVLWANEDYKQVYYIVLIIMLPFFVDLIQNLALMIMQAKGLYYFRAILLLICSILNFIISIPIIKLYGSFGTAIVTAIFIMIGNVIILNFYFHIKLKLDMFIFWKTIMKYSIPIGILFVASYILKQFIPDTSNIYMLGVEILIYTVIYILLIFRFVINKPLAKYIKSFNRK